jgi:hypothetical protein
MWCMSFSPYMRRVSWPAAFILAALEEFPMQLLRFSLCKLLITVKLKLLACHAVTCSVRSDALTS